MPAYTEQKRMPRAVRTILILAAVFIVVALLLNSIFGVRSIEVQGNSYVTRAEVITASGIQIGDSIFSVDPTAVKQRVNGHRYLECISVWRNFFPSSVIITVKETTPRAKMAWMGMLVILGEGGVALEQTAQIDMPINVPEIVGMTASQVRLGQPVQYAVSGQKEALERILYQLDLQAIGSAIAQINIASPDSIFLVTEDGLQITIGDTEQLPEKFALIREVLPRIQTLGHPDGGSLDVSTARTADYKKP